jgi:ribosomal protein S18 acetylase RimI-like enzyme
LATLPENYNDQFYSNHMRRWPELALVCEYIPDGFSENASSDRRGDGEGITPLREYFRKGADGSANPNTPQKEIVGYILGKVEDRPILHPPSSSRRAPSKVVPLYDVPSPVSYNNGQPQQWDRPSSSPQWEKLGHVTSLAVHSHARRLGIASSLLQQLHYHLSECYSASGVGLHVRISNAAAVKLYVETLEYDVADIIPRYYGDGEDAYFMRKELRSWEELNGGGRSDERSRWQAPMQHQQQGNAIPDWVNRDTRSSFFDKRSSMRDTLTPEERAWVNANNGQSLNNNNSLTGKVTRSFRTFLHGGEAQPPRFNRKNFRRDSPWRQRPPWETGPEELRLPRYTKIVRDEGVAVKRERDSSFNARGGGEQVGVVDGFEDVATAASGTC